MIIKKIKNRLSSIRSNFFSLGDRTRFLIIIFIQKKIYNKKFFFIGTFDSCATGNALYFSIACSKRNDIICYVNTNSLKEIYRLKSIGVNAIMRGSVKEKILLKKSDACFTVGHFRSDFSSDPANHVLKVMLWHAIPLKAVGLRNKPIPDPISGYDYVICTSDFTKKIMERAFATTETKMIIAGQPKTDYLFQSPTLRRKLLMKISQIFQPKVITYLPTWRHDFNVIENGDFGKNPQILTDRINSLKNSEKLNNLLKEHNAIFVIKGHSWDPLTPNVSQNNQRFLWLNQDEVNTEELLSYTDIMISDYSGALVDWLILKKSVVCYTFDYEEYISNRGSDSFDYKETFQNFMVYNEVELFDLLTKYLRDSEYKKGEVSTLSNLLHEYQDNKSSERIANQILSLLKVVPKTQRRAIL